MMHQYQIYLLAVFVSLALIRCQETEPLNECRRGVKRAHPTQENAYQIFSRNGWKSQWLDQECPRFQVFDHSVCACTEGYIRKTTPPRPQTPPRLQTQVTEAPIPVPERPPCDEVHRPDPSNPSRYERFSEGGWQAEDCNWPYDTGLVWDQNTCRCEWGPNRKLPQLVNPGQTIPAPCLMMLNMTFNQDIVDDERGVWLKRFHPENARVIPEPGSVGGGCALFQDSFVSVPFFKSNTLGQIFRITFRFKPCDGGDPNDDLILLHNGCNDIRIPPSLKVAYRPWAKIFMVEFETANDVAPTGEECVVRTPGGNSWIDVDIRYQDDLLEVFVNGEYCISSDAFSGDIKTTDCPMNLLGQRSCAYMDELLISRGCRY